ncbi:Tetratricopeptide repeat protein [compost metagenome]
MRTGQYEAALTYFDHLIRLLPEEIDGYLYKARIWYYTGQTNQAAEQCQFILSRWPKYYETLILLGHCFKRLGKPIDGEAFWERALQISDRNQSTQGEQTYLPKTNRRNWKLFLNKRILLHMITLLVTSTLIAGCINYYRYISNENKPVIITNLNDLEHVEQQYTQLSIGNLQDMKIRQYVKESNSSEDFLYENSAYAFRHFDEYGNSTGKVYIGEFNGQHIIILADPAVDLLRVPSNVTVKGYVHNVDNKLESSVTKMLEWGPSNPEGAPEAKLEMYNNSLAIGSSDKSNSNAISVPKIFPKYIEVTAPLRKSPVNIQNIVILGLLVAIWIRSLYFLVFEYRKTRSTI